MRWVLTDKLKKSRIKEKSIDKAGFYVVIFHQKLLIIE